MGYEFEDYLTKKIEDNYKENAEDGSQRRIESISIRKSRSTCMIQQYVNVKNRDQDSIVYLYKK